MISSQKIISVRKNKLFFVAYPKFSTSKIPLIGRKAPAGRLHAVTNDTFHRNPKRKRGQQLRPSLTLRVTARVNRVQYSDRFLRRLPRNRVQATKVPGASVARLARTARRTLATSRDEICTAVDHAASRCDPTGESTQLAERPNIQSRLSEDRTAAGDDHLAKTAAARLPADQQTAGALSLRVADVSGRDRRSHRQQHR